MVLVEEGYGGNAGNGLVRQKVAEKRTTEDRKAKEEKSRRGKHGVNLQRFQGRGGTCFIQPRATTAVLVLLK